MPVLLQQLPPLALAIYVCAGLWGSTTFFKLPRNQLNRPACVLVLLYALCTALSLRTWLAWPWIESVALVSIAPGFWRLCRIAQPRFPSRQRSIVFWVLAIFLILEVIFSALPLYRYDQWTYHLLLAKFIAHAGTLSEPITYDPLFFTGSYEFLGLLARALSDSDTFQQGFQNCLSLLLVGTLSLAVFRALGTQEERDQKDAWAFGFAAVLLVLFGTGDHEGIINSKPDYVLFAAALILIVGFFDSPEKSENKEVSLDANADRINLHPALAGALLGAGLAFKVTWMHFAVACAPAWLWRTWNLKDKKMRASLIIGALCAFPSVGIYLAKNWRFFENPFHPVQTSFFQSKMWNQTYQEFWDGVSGKPKGGLDFLKNFLWILAKTPRRWDVMGAVALLIGIAAWPKHRLRNNKNFLAMAAVFCLYLLVWGLFYSAGIFDRFVSSYFAFPIALCLYAGRPQHIGYLGAQYVKRALLLGFVLPALLYSQVEVTIRYVFLAATHNVNEFWAMMRGPATNNADLAAISKLFEQNKIPFNESFVLSDYPFTYYADFKSYIATDATTLWLLEDKGYDLEKGCGIDFLHAMHVRYVWVRLPEENLKAWAPVLRNSLKYLEPLNFNHGLLYFVPPQKSCSSDL